MKKDFFEVGKSYKTYYNRAIATVISRTEKTVTFRVVYTDYKGVHEKIVKKRIFMAGSEETSLIEFTKDKNDVDFCNAYNKRVFF